MRTLYVADTESTVPSEGRSPEGDEIVLRPASFARAFTTRVWAWGLKKVDFSAPESEEIDTGTTLQGLVSDLVGIAGGSVKTCPIVFFHNLAWDGVFLVRYLLLHGWTHTEKPRKKMEFSTLITETGTWYSMKLCVGKSKYLEIRDLLKILPFSLNTLAKALKTPHQKLVGEVDYAKDRPAGYEPTDEEWSYLKNDVFVMSDALYAMRGFGLTEHLTIASHCMDDYKGRVGGAFGSWFPELPDAEDAFVRQSYRGGWCYCKTPRTVLYNPKSVRFSDDDLAKLKKAGRKVRKIDQGEVYDVNSLYPWAMHSVPETEVSPENPQHVFPVGPGVYFESASELETYTAMGMTYVAKVRVGFSETTTKLPFLQEKAYGGKGSFITETGGDTIELVLTKPDIDLMLEQYDLTYGPEIIEGYAYRTAVGVFDTYIDYWYQVKATAKDPATRQVAKLMLNSLYGKFGTSPAGGKKIPVLSEAMTDVFDEGRLAGHDFDAVDFAERVTFCTAEASKDTVYVPVAAFITSYARGKTVRAAQKNFAIFEYSDTDSIHCAAPAQGIEVDPKKLGAWKNENSFDCATYTRQKTYAERMTLADCAPIDPDWIVKACGAPADVKERLMYRVSEKDTEGRWHFYPLKEDSVRRTDGEFVGRFDTGLVEVGKLAHAMCDGGCVLYQTTFSIS